MILKKAAVLPELRITTYDKIIALLLTASLMSTAILLAMIVTWLCNVLPPIVLPPPSPGPNPLTMVVTDSDSVASEIVAPDPEAAAQDASVTNDQSDVTELFVDEVIREDMSQVTTVGLSEPAAPSSGLPDAAEGGGNGLVGGNPKREPGDGSGGRPRRWFIEYKNVASVEQYGRWLESVGIQPGIVLKDRNQLIYLSKLDAAAPEQTITGRAEAGAEKRLFLQWASGSADLIEMDKQLFARAGIDSEDGVVMHFVSAETEARLAQLELEFAGDVPLSRIRRTHFEIREVNGVPEFAVVRQSLR